ncbi:MAG: carbon storage regulator [Acidobacteria bacterium]|nr:carbon storage regulator [Acidobacteriota bacterium]
MLIITRKKNQKIMIADNIEITILELGRNRVRFGIQAPREIPIHTRLKNGIETPGETAPNNNSNVIPMPKKPEPPKTISAAIGMAQKK